MGFRAKLHGTLADLPGSIGSHGFGITVGGRIVPGYGYATTLLGVQSRLYLVPIYIPKKVRLSHIVTRVSTIGSAGAIARMGIYDANYRTISSGLGEPKNLVIDGGTIGTETVGDRFLLIDGTVLNEGVYWIAMVPQGNPLTQATFLASNAQHPMINANATTPITACVAGSGLWNDIPLTTPISVGNRQAIAPFLGLEVVAWGG